MLEIVYFSLGRDRAKTVKRYTIALPATGVPNTAFNLMVSNLNTIF
jgi:hypothetical protein